MKFLKFSVCLFKTEALIVTSLPPSASDFVTIYRDFVGQSP